MSRKHAILSASGASRWLACPPSARLCDKEPEETSKYAEEGTLAHELAERHLKSIIFGKPLKTEDIETHRLYTWGMLDNVQPFIDGCVNTYTEETLTDDFAAVMIEARLDFSRYVPEGFGTGDFVLYANKHIYVKDLKYGKGVEVSAIENKQLMLYGLGALERFPDASELTLEISQPRLHNYTKYEITADELRSWGESIRDKALEAYGFNPGEHCKFCEVKAKCRKHKKYLEEGINYNYAELTPEELSAVYLKLDELGSYVQAVKKYMLSSALRGVNYPGLKLVEGRTNRKIKNETKLIEDLELTGLDPDEFTRLSLETLSNLKKITKKIKGFDLDSYLYKPYGPPSLTTTDDPRLEYNNPENDFDDGFNYDEI